MQDLNDLYFFARVVEHGGFAPAGRALALPKSKLSRRIAQLEDRLGVRLIQRSTRRFVVTEVGQRYYEHCRAMLVEAEAAQQTIESLQAEPQGTIRLVCPVGLLHFHVNQMLAQFMLRYPKVVVHLEATNRRVDVLNEGVDIAVRVRPLPLEDSGLVMRVLSDRGQCLVASPALIAARGQPDTPEQLADWPSLSRSDAPHERHQWVLHHDDGREVVVQHQPRYITSDMVALRASAVAGVGIAQLPVLMLAEEVKRGTLVRVLPDWAPRREVIHLVFPSRRGMLPAVRALIDFLVEQYASFAEE